MSPSVYVRMVLHSNYPTQGISIISVVRGIRRCFWSSVYISDCRVQNTLYDHPAPVFCTYA